MDYQDALAVVGAGSAHPGGWSSTTDWMERISWHPMMHVLEVGCGTGRTLMYIQQRYGCSVTGVDIRPKMIEKANLRAQSLSQPAKFHIADAMFLPFADETFDLVITESVNVFLKKPERAIQEYHRVLNNNGVYVDVEMVLLSPVDNFWRNTVAKLYGVQAVPDLKRWKSLFSSAKFYTQVAAMFPVLFLDVAGTDPRYPDDAPLADASAYTQPEVVSVLQENEDWMEQNSHLLGYGIFLNFKNIQTQYAPLK
ncbi:class I SAM-dependent methyltransferase [Alicyclobacillaceae bacterium I2511]|nr:class I SAM-dependent methyltransferase [Alicyclobacillaceae bacterium I2511]